MNKFGKRQTHWLFKLLSIPMRLMEILLLLPTRLWRLIQQLSGGLRGESRMGLLNQKPWYYNLGNWIMELNISLLELTGLGEFYEIGNELGKTKTRPLSQREEELARSVFGSAIKRYDRIRIDETAYLGPKQGNFCYVSFYIINSWGPMSDSTFIHELVHVWQYEQIGAVYMPRALQAQHTAEGYDYGGVFNLLQAITNDKTFFDFNLEQQGDIVADFFRLREGLPTQWGKASKEDLWVYQAFIDQLQKGLA